MLAVVLFALTFVPAEPVRKPAALKSTSWVGKTVYVRANAVRIDTAAEPNEQAEIAKDGVLSNMLSYRVLAERPNHVQVKTRESVIGWIRKIDVVLFEEAAAVFTEQIDKNPNDLSGYNRRAAVWRMKGEYDAAIKDATEALRLSPQMTLYNNRALIWQSKKDYEKAHADFAQAITLNPQYALVYANRATLWQAMKEYDKAIEDAAKAIQIQPKFPNAYRARGVAFHAKKQYDEAIADFNRALEIDAKSAPFLTDRAKSYAAKKEHAKAQDDFNAALKLDPKNATWAAEAALWLASCGDAKYRDGKRALQLAEHARSLERTSSLVLQALAAAHAELGQFADAIRWQEYALLDPAIRDDAEARSRLERYRKNQTDRRD